jgi:aspartate kinase
VSLACKFGGSSVADADQILKVKKIVDSNPERKVIVVSAPGKRHAEDRKITDLLYLAHETAKNNIDPSEVIKLIEERFNEIISGLDIQLDLSKAFEIIRQEIGNESADYAASRGEFLNGILVAHALEANYIDPFDHIFFTEDHQLDEEKTYAALASKIDPKQRYVISGFYGRGHNGKVKTFSRGGSDITGAIAARAIKADKYENWTDVMGLLMADPRVVDHPRAIDEVSYTELRELSYMGAQVLHDEAIFPVRELGIPVQIRNTNAPDAKGTMIVPTVKHRVVPIVGIAGKENFDIFYIQKALMNKELGFGRRLLEIFESRRINFEHLPSGIDSVSVVVSSKEVDEQRGALKKDLQKILDADEITNFQGIALIAVVGAGMAYHPGVAATVFTALSKENINVRLIDQGASELNIIIGVENKDFSKAINSIYHAFISS